MKRLIAKWFIGQAFESGGKLPRWVERRIKTDESLRQHRDSMQLMIDRLRTDSNQLFAGNKRPETVSQIPQESRARLSTVAITVASLALLIAAWQFWPRSTTSNVTQQEKAIQDLQLVEAAIARPRKVVVEIVARASNLAQHSPEIPQPKVARFTTKPVQNAGRKLGKVLAAFAQADDI